MKPSIFSCLKRLVLALPRKHKIRLLILQIVILFTAVLEFIGIGSIVPLVTVLTSPDYFFEHPVIGAYLQQWGIVTPEQAVLWLGIGAMSILILVNTIRILGLYATMKVSAGMWCLFQCSLFRYYLIQDYIFHTRNNSATLHGKVFGETARVYRLISSTLKLMSHIAVFVMLIAAIMVVNPVLALIIGCFLASCHGVIYLAIRHKLARNGAIVSDETFRTNRILNESLGGIKEVKLRRQEDEFADQMRRHRPRMLHATASSQFIASTPRFLLEIAAFGSLILIIVFLAGVRNDFAAILPTISLYAMASYRILPAIQGTLQESSGIKANLAALDTVLEELVAALKLDGHQQPSDRERLVFQDQLSLHNIHYAYPESHEKKALSGLSLTIRANQTIGFVGPSGSGKTTAADLLLGLIRPDSGSITLDNSPLDDDQLPNWQEMLGYVPQSIFLADVTIAENIAFGIVQQEIDMDRVREAARQAELTEFVETLHDQFDTIVGERGVQLSGGQRQRIGIARALYHDPQVLVFDEATSALDGVTEDAIIKTLHQFSHKKTLIMVAHRLTTVKDCDIIYLFECGRVVASGTYEALIATNNTFRRMAKVA